MTLLHSDKPTYSLTKIQDCINRERCTVSTREKNASTIRLLNLDDAKIRRILQGLTPKQYVGVSYVSGENPERADVYKKTVSKVSLYIKLYVSEEDILVVISFHKDKSTL